MDTFCRQVIRATVDNEYLVGPGAPRVGVERGSCVGKLIMRRWPVTQALAIQRSANRSFPRAWSTIPAGQYEVTHPLINTATDSASATMPDGAQSISVAPGWVTWDLGRNGYQYLVSYVNGWPHTSLTQAANAGDTVLHVDDVTGWVGASGFAYDGASTESLAVTAVSATTPLALPNNVGTAATGPGTITLTAGLANSHAEGVVVSALPANVLWATVLAATVQALDSGITAVSIQTLPGSETVGGHGIDELVAAYQDLLLDYQRVM